MPAEHRHRDRGPRRGHRDAGRRRRHHRAGAGQRRLPVGGGAATGSRPDRAAEADDQVGGVLGVTRGPIDRDESFTDRLLVGVPNEGIGAKTVAGLVQSNEATITVDGQDVAALQFSQGFLNTSYYGMVLSSTSD